MVTFDDFQSDCQDITGDTTAASLVRFKRWGNYAYHQILAELGRPFTERTQTASTVANQQYYTLPSDALFVKAIKVTSSSVDYPLEEVPDQNTWDILNADVTGTSDIPTFYFVRQGFGMGGTEIGLFPTPASSTSDAITIIYEAGDRDLSNDEYTTGDVTLANGDATVTGNGTTFTTAMVGRYFKGDVDGVWYRIASYTSGTSIELENVYEGTAGAGLAYTIAEAFNLPEDMQTLPLHGALAHYYDLRHDDGKSIKYRALFDKGLNEGKRRWATKTRSAVVKGRSRFPSRSPNYPPPEMT